MARFTDVIVTYFVAGIVMWGAGFIEFEQGGLITFFLSLASGNVGGDASVKANLTDMGGPIGNIVNTLGGGLLAVWQFVSNLITFTFWPVSVLQTVGAPTVLVALMGGTLSVVFVGGFVRVIRGPA